MTVLAYEKPAALREIRTDAHGIIAASAGTGKTYTLQHLVVEILLEEPEVRLDEILLVTFTVAATSDLKAKIRATLEILLDGWETARARGIDRAVLGDGSVEALDEPPCEKTYWVIDAEGIGRLRQALRSFDRAAIYTIHGFCQRILIEHAFANRRPFEQEHVSEEDVIEEAFAELLREDIRPGSEAEAWLTAYLGAGKSIPGLRDRLADYVQSRGQYRPVESVDLEAFEQFVRQLVPILERVDPDEWKEQIKPQARDAEGITARTSNTVARRVALLKREFLPRVNLDDPVATLFALNDLDTKKLDYLTGEKGQIVLGLEHQVCEALRGIGEFIKNCALIVVTRLGERLETRVEELKSTQGYFTFSDMVQVVRDTLAEEDDGHLLDSIRSQYRYGLIDEFQDTDPAQWDIFSKVFVESPAEDRHFLFLIGDPKQAIYGFRGGDVYTYLSACDTLERHGASVTHLTQNFRSTPAVLDACNAIFDADGPVDLGEGIEYEPEGVDPGWSWKRLREDDQFVDHGIRALELTTQRDKIGAGQLRRGLIDCYAREIARILDEDRHLAYRTENDEGERRWESVGAADIYVLCRRRRELHRIAEALRRVGVPFAFLKMPGLFQTPEAEDILDLLLAIDDPHDRSRRARAWMTPFFDLRLSDLEGLTEIDESEPIYAKLLRWHRLAKTIEFTELFDRILEESGLIRRRLLFERGERELTNYLHLFELLAGEGARRIRSVEQLATRLQAFIEGRAAPEDEEAEQQRLETDERAVQLLTIHASKGLQRGIVFVVPRLGGVSKRPPLRFHRDDEDKTLVEWHDNYSRLPTPHQKRYLAEATAEELRLAYVALTRAELLAYVPWAGADSPIRAKLDKDPFGQIVDRLEALRDAGADDAIEFRKTSIDGRRRKVGIERLRKSLQRLPPLDDAVSKPEPAPEDRHRRRRELLLRRWEVTSFSKLKRRGRTTRPEDDKADVEPARPAGVLPGGMATGNFLHRVLEQLDYRRVDQFSRDEWIDDEELRQFFVASARRFGSFRPEAITEAMNLVYDTLRAPVKLAGGGVVDGVRRLDPQRMRREIEFLFPLPERRDDGWRRAFPDSSDIQGGFATGVIDLLFEHGEQVYFADWKSDRAAPYDDEALAEIVEQRYAAQAQLYTLAVCRMLRIETEQQYRERFGGCRYLFVRGMTPERSGRGVYTRKVDWEQLVEYERTLPQLAREAKLVGGGATAFSI